MLTTIVYAGAGAAAVALLVLIGRMLNGRVTSAPLQSEEARELAKRLSDVEDDVANLDRRFMRLRGQVTGSIRRLYDEEIEELEDDDNATRG